MADKVASEQREVATVILWDYASVSVPVDKINLFIHKVRLTVMGNLDEHPRECAFLVYCDTRYTSLAVTRELEKAMNVDVHHVEVHESAWGICKKLHRFHIDYDPGIITLISGPSAAYGPVLTKLSRCGWRVKLIHPENTPKSFTALGDCNWSVESLLDGGDNINVGVKFPHTSYFLVSEGCNTDASLGFLSSVTEQYESRVVYFNAKTAETVLELKANDVENAVSLLEARIRAHTGSTAASAVGPCRLQMLSSPNFLCNIRIPRINGEDNETETNVRYSNALTDVASGESGINSNTALPYTPYTIAPLGLIQQLAVPFRLDAASAAALNIATANVALLQHAAAATAFYPYSTIPLAAAAAAAAAASAASQIMQQQLQLHQQLQLQHQLQLQQQQINEQRLEQLQTVKHEEQSDYNVVNSVSENKSPPTEKETIEEDMKSHREAKIEVFTEDENDYDAGDDDIIEQHEDSIKNDWQSNKNKSMNELGKQEAKQTTESVILKNDAEGTTSEHQTLSNGGTESPLCYSAVVKGMKPPNSGNKPTISHLKKYAKTLPQQNTPSTSKNSSSKQMSQWDQVVVERGGKFNKPAPQCIHWNNPKHRLDFPCRFWHPREQCRYYPKCSNTADECGFAHPFCGDFCRCPKGKRDPQKNHRIIEERYYGAGDRSKCPTSSGNNNVR